MENFAANCLEVHSRIRNW